MVIKHCSLLEKFRILTVEKGGDNGRVVRSVLKQVEGVPMSFFYLCTQSNISPSLLAEWVTRNGPFMADIYHV